MRTDGMHLLLAGFLGIAACGVVCALRRVATASESAGELQLLHRLLERYGSPPMSNALRTLRTWKEARGADFADVWIEAMKTEDRQAREVDRARRYVKNYFCNALRLYEAGYVRRQFVCEVASHDGINLLYDIVEPLERALNPNYSSHCFVTLRSGFGRRRAGDHIVSIRLTRRGGQT